MKILMITTILPLRQTTGGEIATRNFIDGVVAAGHQLDVIGFTRPTDIGEAVPANFFSVETRVIESEKAGMQPYAWMAQALLTGAAYIETKFASPKIEALVRDLQKAKRYDLAIIDHSQMGAVADLADLPKRKIFIAHNAEGELYEEQAVRATSRAKKFLLHRDAVKIGQREKILSKQADQVWVLSNDDGAHFARLDSADKVRVLDLPGPALPPTVDVVPKAEYDVGLLGTWAWDVNRRGLQWFIDEVVPLLPPETRIQVAGRGADYVQNPHANVSYVGLVPSSHAFLSRAKVVVVPSTTGSGIQLKTIEAISLGVPLVTTSIGARGITSVPDFVSVCESAPEMAAAIQSFLDKPPAGTGDGRKWNEVRLSQFALQIRTAIAELENSTL